MNVPYSLGRINFGYVTNLRWQCSAGIQVGPKGFGAASGARSLNGYVSESDGLEPRGDEVVAGEAFEETERDGRSVALALPHSESRQCLILWLAHPVSRTLCHAAAQRG